jgi:Flp pilus assembly protein TadG
MMTPRRSRIHDRGSLTIELTILLPAFLALGVVAVIFGRQMIAQNVVDLAARDAARAASISRTAPDATTNGTTAAGSTLASACQSWTATVDTTGFAVPVGQPAAVTVAVTCVIPIPGIALVAGADRTMTLTSTFTSPLDVYRGRS